MTKAFKGNVVLNDTVLKGGYVVINNGIIEYVGLENPNVDNIVDVKNDYIMPGFIDIHCHSSLKNMATEDVDEMASFHLSKGTTTMLATLYRDIPHDKIVQTLYAIKEAMAKNKNLYGAHLEGPYLSSKYGTGLKTAKQTSPKKEDYQEYFDTGVVRQITCAPEVDGILTFIEDATKNGIVVSIGHSEGSFNDVKNAYDKGAKIETHTFDATGTTVDINSYVGTQDVSFDEACMLMDDMYYEVICDSEWVHVRKEKLALLIKTVGIDRVVCITDCYRGGEDDGRDINVINGELSGSKLTMDRVARNLFNAGYSIVQIAKMTATNASKAINAIDRGEIAVGKKSHLIRLDCKAEFKEILSL